MENTNSYLVTDKLTSLMCKYSFPFFISLLVSALYKIFIANASYLGAYGNAANTVFYPLTIVALAFAVMIGDGCCSYVSISLGAKDTNKASNSIGSAIISIVGISIIIMLVYLALSDQIITLFGGRVNDQTFLLSKEYFFYITLGIPFYMFGQGMNPIIVTAILSIYYLTNMNAVKLSNKDFCLYPSLLKKYLPLGITSFLSQISLVFSMAAVNNMVSTYSAIDPIFSQSAYTHIPMAVIGIVMKFFQIVISISVGTAAGCIPIVGYNIGAKRKDRARALFSYLLFVEALVGFIALLIVEFFPVQLINIFGATNESQYYTDFAIKAFRIYLCLLPLSTVNKSTFIYLQSLGKALESTVISLIREVVLGVGLTLLLPRFFGLTGILYSFPAAEIITFAVAFVIIVHTYKELSTQ